MYDFVDCQGFAGGFTLGMTQAGFNLVGKREHAAGFGMPNCEENRHLLGNDWLGQSSSPAEWQAVSAPVVIGNPPCSGFSIATDKRSRGVDAKINSCMWDFVRFAARCNPTIVAFESVRSAYGLGHALMTALHEELESLTGNAFHLTHVMHNAYDLGGVARRPRYFWVASQVPFGVEWMHIPRRPTTWDAIGDLESLEIKWESQQYTQPPTQWSRNARSASGYVDGHHTARMNPHMQRLDELFKYAYEVGGWAQGETMYHVLERMWKLNGRVTPMFEDKLQHMIDRDFVMGFISPLRWYADHSARVIDGASLYRAIHPTLDRTITHREAARIMGFPDAWRIEPLKQYKQSDIEPTWGKGITVQCGKWLGYWINEALNGTPGIVVGESVAERQSLVSAPIRSMVESDPSVRQDQNRTGQRSIVMPRRRPPTNPVQGESVTEQPAAQPQPQPEQPTDATPAAENTESTESTESTGRRGRPRPQHTVERDQRVLTFLNEHGGNWTIKDLSANLGSEFPTNVVKACLDRLSWGDGNQKNPSNPHVIRVSRSTFRSAYVAAPAEPEPQATPAPAPQPQPQPAPVEQAAPAAPEQVQETTAQWQ